MRMTWGGACSTYWRKKNTKFQFENLNGKYHLGRPTSGSKDITEMAHRERP
jgi:hypothetical protein